MLEDEKILIKHWGSKWSSQNDNWITHLCRYIRFKLIYIRHIIVSNYSERVGINSSYLTKFWISFWVGGGELRRSRTTKIQDSCIETFICFMALRWVQCGALVNKMMIMYTVGVNPQQQVGPCSRGDILKLSLRHGTAAARDWSPAWSSVVWKIHFL